MTTKGVDQLTEAQLEAALAEGLCPEGLTAVDMEGSMAATSMIAGGRPYVLQNGRIHLWGCRCKGTGRVPLLPGLRRCCARCNGSGMDMSKWSRYRPCQSCGGAYKIYTSSSDVPAHEKGRGWVPETTLEGLLTVARSSMSDADFRKMLTLAWSPEYDSLGYTSDERHWRALVAWCRAQEEAQREQPAD